MALTALAAGKKQQEVATNSYSHQQIPQKKYQKRSTKQNICSLLPIWLHTTKSIWHHGPMQGAPLSLPDHVDHEVSLNGHDLRKIKLNMVTIFKKCYAVKLADVWCELEKVTYLQLI